MNVIDGLAEPNFKGFTSYYLRLQRALDDAVDRYERQLREIDEWATGEITLRALHQIEQLEAYRATALLVTAACVEGLANLYLRLKMTPKEFGKFEGKPFVKKWTHILSQFVETDTFDPELEILRDLKRLQEKRNAIAHLKEEVTHGDAVIHDDRYPTSTEDEHLFIGRCRYLPLRLMQHLNKHDRSWYVSAIVLSLAIDPNAI